MLQRCLYDSQIYSTISHHDRIGNLASRLLIWDSETLDLAKSIHTVATKRSNHILQWHTRALHGDIMPNRPLIPMYFTCNFTSPVGPLLNKTLPNLNLKIKINFNHPNPPSIYLKISPPGQGTKISKPLRGTMRRSKLRMAKRPRSCSCPPRAKSSWNSQEMRQTLDEVMEKGWFP